MGRTIPYAVTAEMAVTSTKRTVSHTRMLRRGRSSSRVGSPGLFRRGFRSGFFLAENISDTTRGVDKLGVAGVAFDLLAQVADVDVHRSLVPELVAPHPPQERAAREHAPGAGRQRYQKLELRVGEVHLGPVDGDS